MGWCARERTEDIGQFAGVEAVETEGVLGRVAVIEEVEKRRLPECGLFSHQPLRRPPVQAVARCGKDAFLHVVAGIEPEKFFGEVAISVVNVRFILSRKLRSLGSE